MTISVRHCIFMEQAVLVKGGSCGLFACNSKATNWGHLAMDMLLTKSVKFPKFGKVIVLNFDRNPLEWSDLAALPECHEKLLVLNKCNLIEYYCGVEDLSSEIVKKINLYGAGNISIFVYSFSEVILSLGQKHAFHILQSLSNFVDETNNPESSTSSSLILQFNVAHLSASTIAQFQEKLTTIAVVIPNSGVLSPSVAAEIQTIRRSPATGRVTESLEMFRIIDHALQPLPTVDQKNITLDSEGAGESFSAEASDSNKTSAQYPNPNLGPPVGGSAGRLITFDSTDPEFDEDSDPDADLDL